MLGMEDVTITLAWITTVLSMVGCIIYGLIMWNRGEEED
ncbi:symporter small accessory protein [Bacillus massiliigorillae]